MDAKPKKPMPPAGARPALSRQGEAPRAVLLFDADCNFCRYCVRWLIKRDAQGALLFAALESAPARRLLREHGFPPDYSDSVVLIDANDEAHFKSEAVLRAIREIDLPWRLAAGLRAIPRFLRDPVYTLVSKNRPAISRALGTIHRKWEPPPKDRERFLSL